jgi:hypothetical protein
MSDKPTPKLFYLDEFLPIIREYNLKGMTNSKLCEIINDKAEKITSLNAELLEALIICSKSLATYGSHPIIEKIVNNAIEKSNQ